MLLKISSPNYRLELCTLTESELQDLDNLVLLEKGVNFLVYSQDARKQLTDTYGKDGVLYMIIPDSITDEYYLTNLIQRDFERKGINKVNNPQLSVDTIILGEGVCKDEKGRSL